MINNQNFKIGEYKKALEESFLEIDEEVPDNIIKGGRDVGTTANVVLVTNDKIYCSNAGDSRSILR